MQIGILDDEIEIFESVFLNKKNMMYQNIKNYVICDEMQISKFYNKNIRANYWTIINPDIGDCYHQMINNIDQNNSIEADINIDEAIIFVSRGCDDYSWQHFMQDILPIINSTIKKINSDIKIITPLQIWNIRECTDFFLILY